MKRKDLDLATSETKPTSTVNNSTIHLRMETVPLSVVHAQRLTYENYPEFQRDFVWNRSRQQFLIDSALRQFPVPPILAYRDPGRTSWIIDGKQRMTTLLSYLDNQFATLTNLEPNSPLPLIEANKRYKQLAPEWQRVYTNYPIFFMVMEGVVEDWLPVIFSRLQIHSSLTLGESLWVNNTKTTEAVRKISDHPFWKAVYNDKNERMERLVEGLSIIGLELFPPYLQLRKPELLRLATGSYDERINSLLLKRVVDRLDGLAHVFKGANAYARTDIIPIYQTALLLESCHYDLLASQEGCLIQWFQRAVKKSSLAGHDIKDTFGFSAGAHTLYADMQKHFWEGQLPVLLHQVEGLVKRDHGNSIVQHDPVFAAL